MTTSLCQGPTASQRPKIEESDDSNQSIRLNRQVIAPGTHCLGNLRPDAIFESCAVSSDSESEDDPGPPHSLCDSSEYGDCAEYESAYGSSDFSSCDDDEFPFSRLPVSSGVLPIEAMTDSDFDGGISGDGKRARIVSNQLYSDLWRRPPTTLMIGGNPKSEAHEDITRGATRALQVTT